jgi:isoquinoline 1-oxidoreductase beta subunit
VFNTQNGYVVESFFDELAVAGGKDPYELRRELLSERGRAVLDLAAEKAGWGGPLPDGWGRGIAYWATWGVSHVAEVAEVSVADDGTYRVHRVVSAVDCGQPVNVDGVEAQMEGGIMFALSAMKGEITIEGGRVQQSNFHDYPQLRINQAPEIEVHIVDSDQSPSGLGEMSGPPLTAAVVNAIFDATGRRIRRMPIRADVLL